MKLFQLELLNHHANKNFQHALDDKKNKSKLINYHVYLGL